MAGPTRARRATPARALIVVKAMLLVVVLFQRISLPGMNISIALPAVLGGFTYLWRLQALSFDRRRGALYLIAVILCSAATLGTLFGGAEASRNSLLLLALLYAPFAFALSSEIRSQYAVVLRFYSLMMLLLASLGILQLLLQSLGWRYTDVLGDILPRQLLISGYNTSYPIKYGDNLYKSNGFLFLEPSFFSQFLGLAIIVQLVLRDRYRRLLLFVPALVATVSGTGLVLVGFGIAALALRRGPTWAARVALSGLLLVGVVLLSPFGTVFKARSTETGSSASSGNLRFVKPYQVLVQDLLPSPQRVLLGRGPGSDDRAAQDYLARTGLPLSNPTLQKSLYEYGFFSGLFLVVFIAYAGAVRPPDSAIASCLLVQQLLLSGGLLQPQTAFAVLLLDSAFRRDHADTVGNLPRERERA